MRKFSIITIIACTLIQCTPKNDSKETEQALQDTSSKQTVAETTFKPDSISNYQRLLDSLPAVEESGLAGLEIFKKRIKTNNAVENDQSLNTYLSFISSLTSTLNEKATDEDSEKYFSMFYADSNERRPEAIAYQNRLIKNGMRLGSSEGHAYVTSNIDVIAAHFFDCVTAASKDYLTHYANEINYPYADDGGLSISVEEVGQRLVFWDGFLTKYPDHIFALDAKRYYNQYIYCIMNGLDNTPAFGFENGKLQKEFLDAYSGIITKYPDTRASKILDQYLRILVKSKYYYSEDAKAFVEEKTKMNN